LTLSALTLAGDTTLVGDTNAIVLGTVDQGSNTFLVIADSINLEGAWTGGGQRFVEPFSPISIGLGGAGGQFQLSLAELGILAGGGSGPVTIGAESVLNGGGNGPLTVAGIPTFDVPLTLIGNPITIEGIGKTSGSLTLAAATGDPAVGPISGSVSLGPGTGTLFVSGSSVVLTDSTVNGETGAAAAQEIVVLPPYGPGPYTVDGFTFFVPPGTVAPPPPPEISVAAPPPPIEIPLAAISPQTYIGTGLSFLDPASPDTPSSSGQGGAGTAESSDSAAYSFASTSTGPVNHDRPLVNPNAVSIIQHVYQQENLGLGGGTNSEDLGVISNIPSQ
jgi:hypothetical protein